MEKRAYRNPAPPRPIRNLPETRPALTRLRPDPEPGRAIPPWIRLALTICMLMLVASWCRAQSEHSSVAIPSGVKIAPARSAQNSHLRALYAKLPLRFEANQGQTDSKVRFLAREPQYTLFLTDTAATLSFRSPASKTPGVKPSASWIRMRLAGASPHAEMTGLDELPGKSNYFLGNNTAHWRMGIPSYARVVYQQVYPGIDVAYYGNRQQLEYDFAVSPGADPSRIRLQIQGPAGSIPLRTDARGNLVVPVKGGALRLLKPVAYQETSNGKEVTRRTVASRFVIGPKGDVRFEIGDYDHRRSLIIDPSLVYATYLGGSGSDSATGIAVDGSGNAFITGGTTSTNFPTSNPEQKAGGGNSDVFVTELDPTGGSLVYSTYIGGSGYDKGTGIALDSSGNAYVTGYTSSPDFPTSSKAFSTTYQGNAKSEAFVLKLNSGGASLAYSTYLGGSSGDLGQGIAVDGSGNAYVTGSTQSANFPVANALQGTLAGSSDAFVTKLDAAGATLVYSTFLGGAQSDAGQAIAVDGAGEAYVTGYTSSTDFPTSNPLQSSSGGGSDAFVAKLNAAGSQLAYSTYLGGRGNDRGLSIALDPTGEAFVTGSTESPNFPVAGAYQATFGGGTDGFLAKLNAAGSQLVYSTYLGGTQTDQGNGVAVDASGNAYVIGSTASGDFPVLNPSQSTLGEGACSTPCSNAFVTVVNPQGNGLVYSTYLGGFGPDYGQAVAVDSSGNAYLAGSTASANFPAVSGAFQSTYGSTGTSGNGFVAKVSPANAPSLAITPQKIDFGNQGQGAASAAKTVTLTNVGSAPLSISGITSSSADFAQTNTCGTSLGAGGAQCTISVTFKPSSAAAETGNLAIADNAAGSPQQVTLSGTGTTPTPVATFSPSVLTFGGQVVGTTSAPQTVTLTNTGSADLTITKVTISGAFAEKDNCPGTLAASKSCAIQVTFSPTATTSSSSSSSSTSTTASNSGALSLTDNEKTPPVVNLNGTAVADFSLSSTGPSSIPLIGTTSVTIKVSLASLLSSFADQVSFSCSSEVTCSFDPSSISTGQTTTATVSGVSGSANPLTFTVTGTNTGTNAGTQSAAANVSVSFEDYALAATPSLANVNAGQSATYTVTLSPVSGFNNPVSLSCSSGLPAGASCSFSPASITSNGSSPVSSTVTITTTAHSKSVAGPPPGHREPPPGTPLGGTTRDAILLALLLGLIVAIRLRGRRHAWVALGMVLLLALVLGGCNLGYYGFIGSNPAPTGSPAGVYTVTISGTYTPAASTTGQTAVSRSTSVNLAVQ